MQTNLNYAKAFEYMVGKNLSLAIETVTTHIFATFNLLLFFSARHMLYTLNNLTVLHSLSTHNTATTFNVKTVVI